MTDLEKELYFVVSEWWDEVFSTAVREGRVDDIKKLVKQILEVKNGCRTWTCRIPITC
jgi:hypothetical protein